LSYLEYEKGVTILDQRSQNSVLNL